MTLAADKKDLYVIFFFFYGPAMTIEEWISLWEEDKPKTLGEFEPLKLLNINIAVSELEPTELEHVQINFDNNPEWRVRCNTESWDDARGLTISPVCLCLDKFKIFFSVPSIPCH